MAVQYSAGRPRSRPDSSCSPADTEPCQGSVQHREFDAPDRRRPLDAQYLHRAGYRGEFCYREEEEPPGWVGIPELADAQARSPSRHRLAPTLIEYRAGATRPRGSSQE